MGTLQAFAEAEDEKPHLTVAVHNGLFHPDDVVAVAMLKEEYPDIQFDIMRTRDRQKLETADIVLDVGDTDMVSENQLRLDHHQKDNGEYENGVKMCAASKLADVLYADEPEKLALLHERLLDPLAMDDNGQDRAKLAESKPEYAEQIGKLPQNNIAFVVKQYIPSWNDKTVSMDEGFEQAVNVVTPLLTQMQKQITLEIEGKAEINKVLDPVLAEAEKTGQHTIYIPDGKEGPRYIPYTDRVAEYNKDEAHPMQIEAVGFQASTGTQYNLISVTPEGEVFAPPLPEIEQDGMKFRHNSGFMMAFDSKEHEEEARQKCEAIFEKQAQKKQVQALADKITEDIEAGDIKGAAQKAYSMIQDGKVDMLKEALTLEDQLKLAEAVTSYTEQEPVSRKESPAKKSVEPEIG